MTSLAASCPIAAVSKGDPTDDPSHLLSSSIHPIHESSLKQEEQTIANNTLECNLGFEKEYLSETI